VARENWSVSTFEVQTHNGKRWIIDMSSSKRSEALDYAEKILSSGKHDGVRVTESRDTWREERVVFENYAERSSKVLKINPTDEVEFCKSLDDYYALPARLTMGRILRAYLDEHSLTMLELLFNAGHLRALDRMETFFPSALQHGAMLQAHLTGQSRTDRIDKLQKVFKAVLKRARNNDNASHYATILKEDGLDRAISQIEANEESKEVLRCLYAMVADYIESGGWRDKLKKMVDLAEQAVDPRSVELADEVIAEILDGTEAIEELFGGFSVPVEAWKTYILIFSGRFLKAPKYMSPDIVRLSALFNRHDLGATRSVLMRRISKGLSSTQALSKDGRNEDRSSFIGLIRDLIEPTGLSGGPQMVEAVVLRAKTLLGDGGADLPIETAIRQALYLMPSQAARLGILLDLTATELGVKYDRTIRQQLMHLLNELRSIYDLFPQDVDDKARVQGLDTLRMRLGLSRLGDDLKTTVSESLHQLMNGGNDNQPQAQDIQEIQADPMPSAPQARTTKDGELLLKKGEVLFKEGEQGDEAYLILDGTIEVSREYGGASHPLAIVSKGEILGEMSLIDNQPRMATATAMVDTTLMWISDANLQKRLGRLAKDDQILHFLLKTMVRRLRGLARNTE